MNDEKDTMHEETDIVPEDTDRGEEVELEDIEDNSNAKIKKLREKLKECEREKVEYLENLQRVKADFLNSKRRLEENREQDKERLTNAHIEAILPLYDSFQMAIQNTDAWEAIDANWRKGVEGIFTQLRGILTAYGAKEVNPIGMQFDPNVHEAVANESVTDESKHHTVTAVHQTGFVRKVRSGEEQIIRPARVTVGEFSN